MTPRPELVAGYAAGDLEVRVTRHTRNRTVYAVRVFEDGREVVRVGLFKQQACAEAEARAIARGATVAELGGIEVVA